jgi:hypothetical protein
MEERWQECGPPWQVFFTVWLRRLLGFEQRAETLGPSVRWDDDEPPSFQRRLESRIEQAATVRDTP